MKTCKNPNHTGAETILARIQLGNWANRCANTENAGGAFMFAVTMMLGRGHERC